MCVFFGHSAILFHNFFPKAYDGHMNLILSDVEETIMIVDPDSAPNGQSIVNVRITDSRLSSHAHCNIGRETKNGYVVR